MNFLMIDQSANHLSIILAELKNNFNINDFAEKNFILDDFNLTSFEKKCQGGDEILKMIHDFLHEKNIKLDAIIISHGPGFFNSLRMVAACAQSLALAFDIPLFSFDSLLMHAKYQHINKEINKSLVSPQEGVICVVNKELFSVYIDARMNEYYHAVCRFKKNIEFKEGQGFEYITPPCLVKSSEVPNIENINNVDDKSTHLNKENNPAPSIALLFLTLENLQKNASLLAGSAKTLKSENINFKDFKNFKDFLNLLIQDLNLLIQETPTQDIVFKTLNYVRNQVAADLATQKALQIQKNNA